VPASFKPVETVGRALSVLRAVNAEREASVASIHNATKIDKATIVRMLETLIHEGYIEKDEGHSTYHATGRTLLLSNGYSWPRSIAVAAGQILEEHRAKVGWPSDVAVFDHDAMVIAETSRGSSVLSLQRSPGYRLPLLLTSAGLAYIAHVDPERRAAILTRVLNGRDGSDYSTMDRAGWEARFEEIRSQGYAAMTQEYSKRISAEALWAIAVPIGPASQVFGALNLILIRNAISEREAVRKYLPSLKKTAAEIAARLQECGH
jgi:IclR family transcriptional regulator, mhp operon transcriptional activator